MFLLLLLVLAFDMLSLVVLIKMLLICSTVAVSSLSQSAIKDVSYTCESCTVIFSINVCVSGTCIGSYCSASYNSVISPYVLISRQCHKTNDDFSEGCKTNFPQVWQIICRCQGDYCNGCFPNPCSNGGQCLMNGMHYVCNCPGGFSGNNCDIEVSTIQSTVNTIYPTTTSPTTTLPTIATLMPSTSLLTTKTLSTTINTTILHTNTTVVHPSVSPLVINTTQMATTVRTGKTSISSSTTTSLTTRTSPTTTSQTTTTTLQTTTTALTTRTSQMTTSQTAATTAQTTTTSQPTTTSLTTSTSQKTTTSRISATSQITPTSQITSASSKTISHFNNITGTSTTSLALASTTSMLLTSTRINTTATKTATSITSPLPRNTTTLLITSKTTTEIVLTSQKTTPKPTEILSQLANSKIVQNNVTNVLTELGGIVSENTNNLNQVDIYYVSQILEKASKLILNSQDFQIYVRTVDSLSSGNEEYFKSSQSVYGSCNRILESLDAMLIKLNSTSSSYHGKHIVLQTEIVDCIGDIDPLLGLQQNKEGSVESIRNIASVPIKSHSSVYLPKEVVCGGSRIAFAVFRNFKLFQNVSSPRNKLFANSSASTTTETNEDNDGCSSITQPAAADVFQAKLIGHDRSYQSSLTQPVQLRFAKNAKFQNLLHASFLGGFWKIHGWATEGCYSVSDSYAEMFEFHCTHLTDFTLLVDMKTKDPALCDPTLRVLGTICCSMSCVSIGFLILLFTFEVVVYPRRRIRENFTRLYFLLTLAIFYCLFILLSDSDQLHITGTGCSITAAFIYTLLLSILVQTIVKALDYFSKFYLVLHTRLSDLITGTLLTTLPTFVLPAAVCTILWIFISDFFNRGDSFFSCWVRPDYVVLAVVVPVSVIILADILLSCLLAWNFFKPVKTEVRNNNPGVFRRKMVLLVSMQVILGLPWILQYFTLGAPNVTLMHHLFTIFNALQGLFIAMISIMERKKFVKNTILTVFCHRKPSDDMYMTWRFNKNKSRKISQS